MIERSAPRVDDLVDWVDSGLCVDIEGLPGSGRSTLLHAVGLGLRERGRQIVRLDSVRSLRDRPLGAIGVLERSGPQVPGTSVHDAARQLVKRLGSARSALIIDDVDDLDGLSSGVAHAAHEELRMPVVVSRRPGTDRDAVVRDFVSALQPGVLVRLGPLSFADVHQLLHDELSDTIDPGLVAQIAVMSGGLPGLVKAFATAARAEGRITSTEGVWRLVADAVPLSVGHALAPLLRDLERDDLDALTLLSLAGTPAVASARRLVGSDVLQRLEIRGLVAVAPESGGEIVSVVPPALGEHLSTECGPLRREAFQRLLASETASVTVAEPVPGLRDHLEDTLAAKRLSDHWEAERRVLQKQWTQDPTVARAVPLIVATLVLGASPEQVVRLTRADDGPDDGRLPAWFLIYLTVHERNTIAARQHMAATRSKTAQGLVDATARYLDLLYDHVPDLAELTPPSNGGSALERDVLRQVRVEREIAVGNVRTAQTIAEDSETTRPLFVLHLDIARLLARILDGDIGPATDAAIEAMAGAMRQMDPGGFQGYAYVAAFGLTISGRFGELEALVASALTVTIRTPVEEHYRAGVLALATIAARWQGRRQFARRLAYQARALDDRAGPYPGIFPGQLSVIAKEGGEASAQDMWRLADERLSKGYVAAAAFCGIAALENHPDPDWAAHVWSAAGSSESPVLRALAHYAVALGNSDAQAIEASRTDLAAWGMRTYEARAFVREAIALRNDGSPDRALQRIESAWALTSTFGGSQAGFFEPFIDALELSSREFEIIEMIAGGLTTSQVASELSISPRTVENHVFSCYRKTGIGNREGMSRAVSTWLTAPSNGEL